MIQAEGTAAEEPIDPLVLRGVLSHHPTGVVLVTGRHPDGGDVAMVIGTFLSVSLDPPLVAFLAIRGSSSFERLRQCRTMCVNLLGAHQADDVRAIASRRQDKLAGLDLIRSPAGNPLLAASLAWIDVTLTEVTEAGDHYVAMCVVRDLAVMEQCHPLLFAQGAYGRFSALDDDGTPDAPE